MLTDAQRFANLFQGFDQRHGRFTMVRSKASGKVEGKADTVEHGPTDDDYARHVAGEVGIGIIPLTADNKVYFAAIDIDDYSKSIVELADRVKKLPVVVTKSKSGGTHMWLFTPRGVEARRVVRVLKIWAGQIGYGKSEIFPKQTERAGKDDVGNWINLPYFGDTRKAILCARNGEVKELTLGEFLDYAEHQAKKVTDEFLDEIAPNVKSQRDTSRSRVDWVDGPPCLERMIEQGGAPEGTRNTFFFNAGVYLARKYGSSEVVASKLQALNHGSPEVYKGTPKAGEPLEDREIATLVGQVTKKEYGYQCHQEPLCSHCSRESCLKRMFGVGSRGSDLPVEIDGFTKMLANPPYYFFNANGARVRINSSEELANQQKVFARIFDATNIMLPQMQQPKWVELLNMWAKDRIEIMPPPDVDPKNVVAQELTQYIATRRNRSKDALKEGKVWLDEEKGVAVFTRLPFEKYLKTQGMAPTRNDLTEWFRELGITNSERSVRYGAFAGIAYYAPLDKFGPQEEE